MRLLIYLLAMLTGFSAAEAARPVVVAPSALGSAVAEAAAEIVVASLENGQRVHYLPTAMPSLAEVAKQKAVLAEVASQALSPVTAHDISRQ
jgi:hypothetical protein